MNGNTSMKQVVDSVAKTSGGVSRRLNAVATVALTATLLTACGGGGGGDKPVPTFTVTASLNGLQPGKTVQLSLNGQTLNVTGSLTGTFPNIRQGTAYELTVTGHPLNQLCVVRNGSGTVTSNLSVTVDCHVTVLNDTGQIASIGNVGDSEDFREGRDSVRNELTKDISGTGRAGFDFTRVCANGAVEGELDGVGALLCNAGVVGLGATEWACTRDNTTGLVWLIAPHVPGTVFPVGLCGADVNWTGGAPGLVANVNELLSIVDVADFAAPEDVFVIDQDYFPGIGAGAVKFYSRDANEDGVAVPGGPDPRVFAVNFQRAPVGQFVVEACKAGVCGGLSSLYVGYLATAKIDDRVVLTPQSGDTFVDAARELQWHFRARLVTNYAALQTELDTVNTNDQGGFSDWRIPNIKELNTLLERELCGPGVGKKCTSLGAATVTQQAYWSNTTNPADSTKSILVTVKSSPGVGLQMLPGSMTSAPSSSATQLGSRRRRRKPRVRHFQRNLVPRLECAAWPAAHGGSAQAAFSRPGLVCVAGYLHAALLSHLAASLCVCLPTLARPHGG